ncbi:MAG: hypothetical protein EA342_02255 [Leptolyngbya sp. LCM1.Bin17]|nr:MAG: hypothetical protein EA342_02255 [Leptolyngbya sp. LCM1.Bin17]
MDTFLHYLGKSITGLSEKELEEAGRKLYKSLRSAIPQKQREKRRKASENKGISDLTLADLMENKEIDLRLSRSWETISERATLWDAKKLMSLQKKCQDLIVTATGKRDEPVLGWLTDRDISWNTDRDINQN